MASTPTFDPNPYANFDPSQWTNPYSNFQNSAIPFPATYSGWPTDASGNPIQAPPGMTLNSSPAQPAAPPPAPAAAPQQQYGRIWEGTATGGAAGGQNAMGSGGPTAGQNVSGYGPIGPALQQAPPPMPTPAANPAGLTSQQYLQLRANPGRVVTPGATVPQSAGSATPGPGMLQQFLANWNPATSGPGSGFQQAFSKALRGS
jgi:hypothetical protein